MSKDIILDVSRLIEGLENAADVIERGAKRGLHDAMDEWLREATDLAPLKTGTLRRGISTEVKSKNGELKGEIQALAVEEGKGGRFNYAYYIHEIKGEIANPTTPGTIAKFLDAPLKQNEKKWIREIEAAIEHELKKEGW